jgi:NAD(P)-dependent dehydrogenase (short-subunit alcohol dehydrogenase family)
MGILNSKRVIITGGAGGIGNAVLHMFHEEGARIACTFRSERPNLPEGVLSEYCDVANKSETDTVFDGLVSMLGGLDVLIHAAGVHGACPADQLTEEAWDHMFALNGKAALFTNQAAFRHMRSAGGSIVNMGSVEGIRGSAGNACYAATRGAVMSWTRSIALEWGRYNIRANCVAPVVHTRLAERMSENLNEAARTEIEQFLMRAIPLGGQMGDPLRDLAPVITFLASDASHFITGQTIPVDGGFMMLGS